MTLIFDEIASLWIHVAKNALNHFLVNSIAKDSLKRAKNVVYFLFCILFDRPMGGGGGGGAMATLLTMLLPIPISIALGPWHFGDFRNIFLPNVGEDHKKS